MGSYVKAEEIFQAILMKGNKERSGIFSEIEIGTIVGLSATGGCTA